MLRVPESPIDTPRPAPRIVIPGEIMSASEPQPVSENRCFLCGRQLVLAGATVEHVFPGWLQRRHRLHQARIELLNNSLLRYDQLLIPCCTACNTVSLNAIERRVQRGFEAGLRGIRELQPYDLYLWLCKLSYGTLFRELFLPFDRRRAVSSRPIVDTEHLARYHAMHVLLQGAYRHVRPYRGPASIYIFETQVSDNPKENFDFADNVAGPFIALRSNEIGIIAILQDWGAHRQVDWRKYEEALECQPLAPLQFRELIGIAMYNATLLRWDPEVSFRELAGCTEVRVELPDRVGADLYGEVDEQVYAQFVSRALGSDVDTVYRGNGRLSTWLRDDDGRALHIPFHTVPAQLDEHRRPFVFPSIWSQHR